MARSHRALALASASNFSMGIRMLNDSIHTERWPLALVAMLTPQSEWVLYPFP